MKKICILGSTGSIGTQVLDVVDNLQNIEIVALSTNKNIDLLQAQILKYRPKVAVVMDEELSQVLRSRLLENPVEILWGLKGLVHVSTMDGVDVLLNSLMGNVGLVPTYMAIEAGKDIALANKETLVTAGELIMSKVNEKGLALYPIDSEHSAIFQCLVGNGQNNINKIHLTASGGPFRGKLKPELEQVTVQDALAHPKWVMGSKITIDSATLMNKGLEVIEAKWLFDVPVSKISVMVHPQSIVHSMVEYDDGSVMAQLGEADMRIPIQYALTYPHRVKNDFKKINFFENSTLTFEKPDLITFPCLQLAFDAINTGGTMPCVLNAANEIAVELFLKEKIKFLQIPTLIEMAMKAYTVKYNYTIDDVLEADTWARDYVRSLKN